MAANTRLYSERGGISATPHDYIPVAKHDATADPSGPFRGFIMSDEGAVKLTTVDGVDRTFAIGTFKPGIPYGYGVGILRFWSTGTGAQTIYGIV